MFKIYVSSTFKDLKGCRKKVSEAIRLLGHFDVAMEYYVAESLRPLDRCLKDVADCDVYIGIFARRYGWIPPGEEISITELEYREAVRCKKDLLLFLLRDDVPRWPASDAESSDKRSRLYAIRTEMTDGRRVMPAYFSSCNDLALRVTAAIANLAGPRRTPLDLEREEMLFKLIDSKDEDARRGAAQALVDMGSTLYAVHLRQQLARRRLSKQKRIDGLQHLLEIQSRNGSVMPLLRHLLRHDDAVVRSEMVREIGQRALAGQIVDADAVRAVLSLCDDQDVLVRREVAHAIWKLPNLRQLRKEVDACLAKLSHDEDHAVTQMTAYSIRRLRDGRA